MNAPKVLLIGGPPGAGKTTLGRAIASEMGYPSLTVDDIKLAVQAMTTVDTHPALHQAKGHIDYFTAGPIEKLVSDAIALQDVLWPAVERVIRVHATVKEPIVIDWWLLSPPKVAALELENVTSIWLHIDSDVLEERERLNNSDYWSESADPEKMIDNFMYRSRWRNRLVCAQAKELGLSVIHQPGNRPVDELVQEVIQGIGWNCMPESRI